MQRYSDFAPTGFDSKGLALDDRQDWLVVPCSRTRDSDALERSNFKAALALLDAESLSDDSVEVHRFGHWACGWFEIIIVKPGTLAEERAKMIEAQLRDYPVLDDDAFSAEEHDEAAEWWEYASVADRVHAIQRYGDDVSVFAARSDEMPYGLDTGEMIRS